jgi:hypothetical protein
MGNFFIDLPAEPGKLVRNANEVLFVPGNGGILFNRGSINLLVSRHRDRHPAGDMAGSELKH